jgi:hypothetical protein
MALIRRLAQPRTVRVLAVPTNQELATLGRLVGLLSSPASHLVLLNSAAGIAWRVTDLTTLV